MFFSVITCFLLHGFKRGTKRHFPIPQVIDVHTFIVNASFQYTSRVDRVTYPERKGIDIRGDAMKDMFQFRLAVCTAEISFYMHPQTQYVGRSLASGVSLEGDSVFLFHYLISGLKRWWSYQPSLSFIPSI